METNCSICIPGDANTLEIISSTQNLSVTQDHAARVCGIDSSKVVAHTKRIGGGFGGKETRSVPMSSACAVAAYYLKKPVSLLIERDIDFQITGHRHPFHFKYEAGCTKDGMLQYLDVSIYANAGFSRDLSQPVVDRALLHIDNCYKWPALSAQGWLCKTNHPSHCAFRGFGGPQGMMVSESVIQHLAETINMPVDIMRGKNIYKDDDVTHFQQPLIDFYVPKLWQNLHKPNYANINERHKAVDEFNRTNRFKKRGLAVLPTKFGVSFTLQLLNQGGALVHIYQDGTVLVTHGGVEVSFGLIVV